MFGKAVLLLWFLVFKTRDRSKNSAKMYIFEVLFSHNPTRGLFSNLTSPYRSFLIFYLWRSRVNCKNKGDDYWNNNWKSVINNYCSMTLLIIPSGHRLTLPIIDPTKHCCPNLEGGCKAPFPPAQVVCLFENFSPIQKMSCILIINLFIVHCNKLQSKFPP